MPLFVNWIKLIDMEIDITAIGDTRRRLLNVETGAIRYEAFDGLPRMRSIDSALTVRLMLCTPASRALPPQVIGGFHKMPFWIT
jgi:hypothetical protein